MESEKEFDAKLYLAGNDLILKLFSDINISTIRPLLSYDSKLNFYRALPMNYYRLRDYLSPRFRILDEIEKLVSEELTFSLKPKFELRDYQREAVNSWVKNDCRGVIVLPTGTGKTFAAMHAISLLGLKTLVVVPTINLLTQWKESLQNYLGTEVGIIGGGLDEKKEITIITYDSAYLRFYELLDFGLLIFDEVHHLPSPMYRRIAQGLPAFRRLGITATPERTDEFHKYLDDLVGKEVYRSSPQDVSEHISPYKIQKIFVELNESQKIEYENERKIFTKYCKNKNIFLNSPRAFQRLIYLSFRDNNARQALKAHRQSRNIALNSQEKMKQVENIFLRHRDEKIIVFSEFNSVVHSIGHSYFVPAITHKTRPREREKLLKAFRDGRITKIATSRVLDEGWDVQDASVGIIVSGSSVKRQQIQRLGRLLRKKEGKEALLYELISKGTSEEGASRRRSL